MSKISELTNILGSREAAEEFLEATKDWSDELVSAGIKFKNLNDIESELEGLSFSELRTLKDAISKLLTKRRYGQSDDEQSTKRKIILTYEPDREKAEKSNEYVHPLARNAAEGIEAIEQARREVKLKSQQYNALSRSFQEGLAEIEQERINRRKHKGRGRWSDPPIELVGQKSIQAILEWRKQHGQEGGGGG